MLVQMIVLDMEDVLVAINVSVHIFGKEVLVVHKEIVIPMTKLYVIS